MQLGTQDLLGRGWQTLTRWGLVALTGAAVIAAAAPAHANLVLNPGFETGDLTDWAVNFGANHPWTAAGGPVNSGSFAASTGCVGAACTDQTNPGTASSLSQVLTTVPGTTYSLTFWFEGAGAEDELKVLWGGSVVLDLVDSDIVSNASGPLTEYTVNDLTANTISTTLSFLGRQDPGFDRLDDVDVEPTGTSNPNQPPTTPVPEPATLALFGAALAGFGWMRRRKA
jgi:hypothetical protein